MLGAFSCSSIFLASYLYFHWHVGNVRFGGQGWIRPVYFTILITHTTLAVVIVPLVLITLSRALRQRFRSPSGHRALDISAVALRFDYRSDRLLAALHRVYADRCSRYPFVILAGFFPNAELLTVE